MPKHVALNYPMYGVVADGYYIHMWPNWCLFSWIILGRLLQAMKLELESGIW